MSQDFNDSNATVSPISPQDIIEVFEEKFSYGYLSEINSIAFNSASFGLKEVVSE